MIDALLALPRTLATPPGDSAPVATDGVRTGAATAFGATLGAFLDAHDASAASTPPSLAPVPDRQAVAEDGKPLPATPDQATDDDALPDAIWAAWVAPPPIVCANANPLPAGVAEVGTTADSAPPAPPRPADVAAADRSARAPAPACPTQPPPADVAPAPSAPAAMPEPLRPPLPDQSPAASHAPPAKTETSQPNVDAPGRDAGQPLQATPAPAPAPTDIPQTPQPARQVFAAAIAAAAQWERPARRDDPASAPAAILTVDPPTHQALRATEAAHDAPLDLGQDRGLQQMIDRIESLRDDASADADTRSTRIRLMPDALGGVDIAVRKQGDALHVHFSAEREATHALLLEAQPRLTELAAARGVRLAETGVSTGGSAQPDFSRHGDGSTPQPRRSATPKAPATADPHSSIPDDRLA